MVRVSECEDKLSHVKTYHKLLATKDRVFDGVFHLGGRDVVVRSVGLAKGQAQS